MAQERSRNLLPRYIARPDLQTERFPEFHFNICQPWAPLDLYMPLATRLDRIHEVDGTDPQSREDV